MNMFLYLLTCIKNYVFEFISAHSIRVLMCPSITLTEEKKKQVKFYIIIHNL